MSTTIRNHSKPFIVSFVIPDALMTDAGAKFHPGVIPALLYAPR